MTEIVDQPTPDFDAMSNPEFEAYPDTPAKRDYIVSLYRAALTTGRRA